MSNLCFSLLDWTGLDWRLTCVLDVEVRGLGPGAVAGQRGGPDPHRVIPRMHHFELAASGLFVRAPRHAIVQFLREERERGKKKTAQRV